MEEIRIKKQPWARGTVRPKLDLRLATLLELGPEAFADYIDPLERARNKVSREGPLAFLGGAFLSWKEAASAPPFVSVFLTARDPESFVRLEERIADKKARFNLDCTRILSKAGSIATAQVALDDVKKLEDDDDVLAIEWTGAVRPAAAPLDAEPGFLAPRASIGLQKAPPGLDGRGTLIGIIDIDGLDLYHPSFVNELGRSRVLGIWDQRGHKPAAVSGRAEPASSLPPVAYGRVYDRETIDYETSPRQPLAGAVVEQTVWKGSHGTMTAGLAAGLAGDRPEAEGIAPGADLLFVNTYGSGVGALGAMTELADALDFVFRSADAAGRPCVVNVSMGDDLGPRDGTSPVELFIDALLEKPGRAVVLAAGNSAENGRRAKVRFEGDAPAVLRIDVGPGNYNRAVIEIWYRTQEGSPTALEVEIEAPGGERTPRIPCDGRPRVFDAARGAMRALVASSNKLAGGGARGASNGLVRIELLSKDSKEALLAGIWQLHLFPRGGLTEAHAWLEHRYAQFRDGDQSKGTSLTTPASSHKAITVGAWDPAGKKVFFFSGRGPCRDGARKPDVVAPGGPLLVASAKTTVRHVPASGTSMAAPLVTGAVALLFQKAARALSSTEILPGLFPPGAGGGDEETGFGVLNLAHWFESAAPAEPRSPPAGPVS